MPQLATTIYGKVFVFSDLLRSHSRSVNNATFFRSQGQAFIAWRSEPLKLENRFTLPRMNVASHLK
jgi:hypothetical protein